MQKFRIAFSKNLEKNTLLLPYMVILRFQRVFSTVFLMVSRQKESGPVCGAMCFLELPNKTNLRAFATTQAQLWGGKCGS